MLANELRQTDLFVEFNFNNLTDVSFVDIENKERIGIKWPGDYMDIQFAIQYGRYVLNIDDAKHKLIGSGLSQRDVYHFITAEHCKHLRAGLTVHRSLASSTPHTFELEPEPGFEELFWFRIADGGKALIEGEGLWPDGTPENAAWPVRDLDVAQVPMGSHRVMALPDVDGNFPQVSYVWCYLAKEERWEK